MRLQWCNEVALAPAGDTFDFSGTSRFQIIRALGSGGMGVVYEARDLETNRLVALKALRGSSPAGLLRFKREFRSLQDLEHPNLVSLGELFEWSGKWFFTMELIDGKDIVSYVRPDGAELDDEYAHAIFNEDRLRAVLPQLVRGIHAIHVAGKIHRDIKPPNVLVTTEGRVVILDFGLVGDVESKDSSSQNLVGTAWYMAPEQAISSDCGPEADWYALGVILYEALTGTLPHAGRSTVEVLMKKQQYSPPPPRTRNPDVPKDLDELCIDLLSTSREERPGVDAILERLGASPAPEVGPYAISSPVSLSAPFVGRARELAVLQQAYESVREGNAVTVLIHGESGLGKSMLAQHFTDELLSEAALSPVVFRGRCHEREYVPYKAFDGIVDALCRYLRGVSDADAAALLPLHAALLPRLFPVLARVPGIAHAPRPKREVLDPLDFRSLVFESLRDLLARLAERRPLVLLIDDYQWADADSRALLHEILSPPDVPPLLLLVTSRTHGDGLGLPANKREISLEALEEDDAVALAEELLARAQAGARLDAAAIAREAHGHPLYISELVRHAVMMNAATAEHIRLGEAIWTRACQFPKRQRQILEVVSLAGEPLAQEIVRDATGLETSEFAKAIALLRLAHLVRTLGARASDPVEPYHDRVREAVLAMLSEAEQREWHERIASALQGAGLGTRRPELLVLHLEAAGDLVGAADRAIEAARRAQRTLAFDRAAQLLRVALRVGELDERSRQKHQVELGTALVHAGRGREAADAFLAAAKAGNPADRLAYLGKASEQLLISGHLERGLEALNALLAEVGSHTAPTPKRAMLSLLWTRMRLRLRWLRWRPRREGQIPREDLLRLDAYMAAASGLSMVDNIRGADFTARCLLRALRAGEPTRIGRALGIEIISLLAQGGRSARRARKLTRVLDRLADETGDTYLQAWSVMAAAGHSYFAGQFLPASEALDEAFRVFRVHAGGAAWETDNARLVWHFTVRFRGAYRDGIRRFEEDVRDAQRRGDRYAETSLRRCCNFLWLAFDEPKRAHVELEQARWLPPEGGFHLQHYYELEARLELALYEGKEGEVAEELEPYFAGVERSLLTRLQVVRSVTNWLRGRMLLAMSARDPSRTDLRAQAEGCARRLRKERAAYPRVFGDLLRAAASAQAGDRERASAHLREVARAGEPLEMWPCVTAAWARRGQLIGGGEGEALIRRAEEWAQRAGVANPSKHWQVHAPGFGFDPRHGH